MNTILRLDDLTSERFDEGILPLMRSLVRYDFPVVAGRAASRHAVYPTVFFGETPGIRTEMEALDSIVKMYHTDRRDLIKDAYLWRVDVRAWELTIDSRETAIFQLSPDSVRLLNEETFRLATYISNLRHQEEDPTHGPQ
jgi:hypothetical protein